MAFHAARGATGFWVIGGPQAGSLSKPSGRERPVKASTLCLGPLHGKGRSFEREGDSALHQFTTSIARNARSQRPARSVRKEFLTSNKVDAYLGPRTRIGSGLHDLGRPK